MGWRQVEERRKKVQWISYFVKGKEDLIPSFFFLSLMIREI